jgi:hypothetical protein
MGASELEWPDWQSAKQEMNLNVAQTDLMSRAFRMRLLRLEREGTEPSERDLLLADMAPLPWQRTGKGLKWSPDNCSYFAEIRAEVLRYIGSLEIVCDVLKVHGHAEVAGNLEKHEISLAHSVLPLVEEVIQVGNLANDLRDL